MRKNDFKDEKKVIRTENVREKEVSGAVEDTLVTKEEVESADRFTDSAVDDYVFADDENTIKIRNLTSGLYDLQKLRISTGNRIVRSFNAQMGQADSTKQDDMQEEAQKVIQVLRKEYSRITDAYVDKSYIITIKKGKNVEEKTVSVSKNSNVEKVIKQMNADTDADIKLISSKLDYDLMSTYMGLLDVENNTLKILKKEVERHPMWDAFFKDVTGCGPLMAAVCLSFFNIHKARHASSFFRYCGIDVVEVERPKILGWDDNNKPIFSETETEWVSEGRAKWHTEMREYTDKDGNVKEKRSITYNEKLRTRLLGVLGPSFLKKPGCKYEQIYRNYRHRLDNRVDTKDYNDLHKHRMAIRYMIKQFVRDMWVTWRALEGYEVSEPYEIAFLGRKPHGYNEYHERVAQETRRARLEREARQSR